MDADGRKQIAQAAVSALVCTVATELAKWAVEAAKNRPREPRDAEGFVVIE